MRLATHLGGARTTVGLALGLVVAGGGERRVGLAALIANAGSHLAVQILKRLVSRPRPCDAGGHALALIELPDPYSFPSGHAAAATAIATTLTFAHPWLAPLVLPLAAVVAVSRVTLRVHHLVDVIAGAALGLAGALLACLLFL